MNPRRYEELSRWASWFFDRNHWREARRLMRLQLREKPGSHWLLTRIGTTYYEQRDYKRAMSYSKRALRMAPHCPLVLWDYAGTLDMLGDRKSAIAVWRRLIKRGVRGLSRDECSEGMVWTRALVNDCWFRLGIANAALGRTQLARSAFQTYLRGRKRGARSIYRIADARKRLRTLTSKP